MQIFNFLQKTKEETIRKKEKNKPKQPNQRNFSRQITKKILS